MFGFWYFFNLLFDSDSDLVSTCKINKMYQSPTGLRYYSMQYVVWMNEKNI